MPAGIAAIFAIDLAGVVATIRHGGTGGPFGYLLRHESMIVPLAAAAYFLFRGISAEAHENLWKTLPVRRATQLTSRITIIVALVALPVALTALIYHFGEIHDQGSRIPTTASASWIALWLGAYASVRQPTAYKSALYVIGMATLVMISGVLYARITDFENGHELKSVALTTLAILLPAATLLRCLRRPRRSSRFTEPLAWAASAPLLMVIVTTLHKPSPKPPPATLPRVTMEVGTACHHSTYDGGRGTFHDLTFRVPEYPQLQSLRHIYRMTIHSLTLIEGPHDTPVIRSIPVTHPHSNLIEIEMPPTPDLLPTLIAGQPNPTLKDFAPTTGRLMIPITPTPDSDISWEMIRGKTLVIEGTHEVYRATQRLVALLPLTQNKVNTQTGPATIETYHIQRENPSRWEVTMQRLSLDGSPRDCRRLDQVHSRHVFLVRKDTGENLLNKKPILAGPVFKSYPSDDVHWPICPATNATDIPDEEKTLAVVNFDEGERIAIPISVTVKIPSEVPSSAARRTNNISALASKSR